MTSIGDSGEIGALVRCWRECDLVTATILAVPQKAEQLCESSNSRSREIPQSTESRDSNSYLYTNVHSNTNSHQKVETIQMSQQQKDGQTKYSVYIQQVIQP